MHTFTKVWTIDGDLTSLSRLRLGQSKPGCQLTSNFDKKGYRHLIFLLGSLARFENGNPTPSSKPEDKSGQSD